MSEFHEERQRESNESVSSSITISLSRAFRALCDFVFARTLSDQTSSIKINVLNA